ncbi:hypothetical protein CEQ90_03540 [Lewinellaceae bacterium SD302]|nr:hypothetical protein CEQ90_03540 [Lewinellaceae bacterium SD302]
MSTLIRHLNYLSPVDFDEYLRRGWRTTGQAVYNCNFLRIDSGDMISVLPLRLNLNDYVFSRSLRKLLRRNLSQFRVTYGPARRMDEETYKVNQAYRRIQPDKSLDNLNYHITGNYNRRVLNTWETRIYAGDELVAFSYFDLGQRSVYGKAGIYHPDYASYSLGIFTMALEIEFCLRLRMEFYYPGYVSDEDTLFDYKHRLGKMDFYDVFSQSWLPHGEHPVLQRPLAIIHDKLTLVAARLNKSGALLADLYSYPHLDARYSSFGHSEYLDVPLFLLLKQTAETRYHILVYQPEKDNYAVLKVRESQYGILEGGKGGQDGPRRFAYALIIEKLLLEPIPDPAVIVSSYLNSYCI